MGQVTIKIAKREFAIKCEDGQEAHILKLSRLLDEKANLLEQSLGLINENMMLAMVGLLLADELQECKNNAANHPNILNTQMIPTDDSHIAQSIDEQTLRINALIKTVKETN